MRAGRRLLIQRRRPPEAGCWGLLGGKVDWLEPLPNATAREIAEGLGLVIDPRRLLCVVDQIDEQTDQHWVARVYLVENAAGEPRVLEPNALAACGWFWLDQLPSPLTHATEAALPRLLAARR